jgi:replicative DNA helicase
MSADPIIYDDEGVERKVLAYHITDGGEYFHPLSPDIFEYALHSKAQQVLNNFYKQWGQAPRLADLEDFPEADLEVRMFLSGLSTIELSASGYRPAVDKLWALYARRRIVDHAKEMVESVGAQKGEMDIVREMQDKLSALKHPLMNSEIERAFAGDEATKVWEVYQDRRDHPEKYQEGVRYGIYELDQLTGGGTRPGHITLIYGDTSSGKTRLKVNLAYNMAMMGKRVLYISIEDSLRTIVSLFLSRAAMVDFGQLQRSTLTSMEESKLRDVCTQIHTENKLPYIVYWTGLATSADLRREIDMYAAKFGHVPDVVFFDYSNEAYPVRPYTTTSERYNYLFSEYRQIFAQYRCSFITSLQESRSGKLKKKESDFGLDSIGQSHYVAPHCHVICYIHRPEDSDSGFDIFVQKNRYGARNRKISLYASWQVGYIGDMARLVSHKHVTGMLAKDAPPTAPMPMVVQSAPLPQGTISVTDTHPVNAAESDAADPVADAQIGEPFDDSVYGQPVEED